MPKIRYQDINFHDDTLATIEIVNTIIADYQAQGFDLTLRQLYYQMVSRGLLPNNDREYKRLGNIVNDGRLAGLIDWEAIVDRTRNLRSLAHWQDAPDILGAAAQSFRLDRWSRQAHRPEVWIEKDALVGVIAGVCERFDVPYFSCRGYTSQSEMWAAAGRLKHSIRNAQRPLILHLGDHDPSGIDMTRDITDRLGLFMGGAKVERLALNWDQVRRYSPPPNPAKLTDARADGYLARFGRESWELDALEPAVIADLIERAILQVRHEDSWQEAVQEEEEIKAALRMAGEQWDRVASLLGRL